VLSHSSRPTLPFVIPYYHVLAQTMKHATRDMNSDIKIRHGARHGLEKLMKYKLEADANQYCKLATSTSLTVLSALSGFVLLLCHSASSLNAM